jgi:hypothetical protein
VLQTNTGADPTWSTATYPSTTTINQILYSSSANVVAGLATANQSVLTTGTTGIPVLTSIATNGQLIIGSTAGAPAAATLTAGTGIAITNGSNSITIAATGGALSWTDVTGTTQAMAVNSGYTADNAGLVTLTLPSTAAYGSMIRVVGKGAGLWAIAQNSGQTIHFGADNTTTGTGGSLSATLQYDCVELLCSIANTDFTVMSSVGNITVV